MLLLHNGAELGATKTGSGGAKRKAGLSINCWPDRPAAPVGEWPPKGRARGESCRGPPTRIGHTIGSGAPVSRKNDHLAAGAPTCARAMINVPSHCGQLLPWLRPRRSFADDESWVSCFVQLVADSSGWRGRPLGSGPMARLYALCAPLGRKSFGPSNRAPRAASKEINTANQGHATPQYFMLCSSGKIAEHERIIVVFYRFLCF